MNIVYCFDQELESRVSVSETALLYYLPLTGNAHVDECNSGRPSNTAYSLHVKLTQPSTQCRGFPPHSENIQRFTKKNNMLLSVGHLDCVSLLYSARVHNLGTHCNFDMLFDRSICRPFLRPSINKGREPRREYDEVRCSTFDLLKVSTICIDWSTSNLFLAQNEREKIIFPYFDIPYLSNLEM